MSKPHGIVSGWSSRSVLLCRSILVNLLANWNAIKCGHTCEHFSACIGCSLNKLCAVKHNDHKWLHKLVSERHVQLTNQKNKHFQRLTPYSIHWYKTVACFHCSRRRQHGQSIQCHRRNLHLSKSYAPFQRLYSSASHFLSSMAMLGPYLKWEPMYAECRCDKMNVGHLTDNFLQPESQILLQLTTYMRSNWMSKTYYTFWWHAVSHKRLNIRCNAIANIVYVVHYLNEARSTADGAIF